jgi:hypothetical protein
MNLERYTAFTGGFIQTRHNFLPLIPLGGAMLSSGAGIGGAAAGGGGLLGGLLFGGAGGAGLLGMGGKFNPFQAMTTAGMGLGLMQSFGGGGSSSGFAPTAQINLSPEGKKLEKTTYQTIKKQYETGLMPPNLASIKMGRIKRKEGVRHRAAMAGLGKLSARRVRTGAGVGAALAEGGERMEGLTAPKKWLAMSKEEEARNALVNLINFRNTQLQVPLLKAQTGFANYALDRQRGAQQGSQRGAALGGLAQYLAMMKWPLSAA